MTRSCSAARRCFSRLEGIFPAAVLAAVFGALLLLGSAIFPVKAAADVSAAGDRAPDGVLSETDVYVVGGEPKYLLSEGSDLWVSDFGSGSVARIDMATGLVAARLSAPGGPVGLAFDPTSRTLYVAAYFEKEFGDDGCVYALDAASGERRAVNRAVNAPWDLRLISGPNEVDLLAVTEHHGNKLTFLDPVTLEVVASVPTGRFPYQMDVDAARRRLYVISYGDKGGGLLQAIDLTRLSQAWDRRADTGSFDVRTNPVDGTIAVTNFSGHSISTFTPEGKRISSWSAAPGWELGAPKSACYSNDGGLLYAALQDLAALATYDVTAGKILTTAEVGLLPGAVGWLRPESASAAALAAANQGDGTVSVLTAGKPVPKFQDVTKTSSFYRAIRVLAARGAISGYAGADGSASFRPQATLTRAQASKVLVGSLGLHTSEIEPASTDFEDVDPSSGTYPFDYVQEAARAGIVCGVEESPPLFAPYQPVTRIQLVRMLVRAAARVASPLPVPPGGSPFFDITPDDPDLPAIKAAWAAGLVAGKRGADGRLRLEPYSYATRGQTCQMVFNLLGALHREGT